MRYYPVLPVQFEDMSIEELGFEGPDGVRASCQSRVYVRAK